jgi:H+-translocating NAD(P) transhydrogenase
LLISFDLKCVAMNRSLTNVLFGGIGTNVSAETHKMEGTITKTTVEDTAEALANADNVILVMLTIISMIRF